MSRINFFSGRRWRIQSTDWPSITIKSARLALGAFSSRVKAKHALRISQLLNQVDQMKYPCMAMYMPGKITQVGQRYLRRMQARFRRRVADSRTVILIGVRPWDSDTHLWPAIYKAPGTVLYVGSRGDCDVLASRRGKGHSTLFVSDRFEEAISVLPGEM